MCACVCARVHVGRQLPVLGLVRCFWKPKAESRGIVSSNEGSGERVGCVMQMKLKYKCRGGGPTNDLMSC